MNFKKYITESKDIFGFGEKKEQTTKETEDGYPIYPIDLEKLSNHLSNMAVNGVKGNAKFVNQIEWDNGSDAIQVLIHPNLIVSIKRKIIDGIGQHDWITKYLTVISRKGVGGNEYEVAERIFELVEKESNNKAYSFDKEFNKIENLVQYCADQMRMKAPDIFNFDKIKEVKENYYLISFIFSGSGFGLVNKEPTVVINNQTGIYYNKSRGVIIMNNTNLNKSLKGGSWQYSQNDFNFVFSPRQDKKEIADVLCTMLRFY